MLKMNFTENAFALRILASSIEKGNQWYESSYFDFGNKCIYFNNSRLRGKLLINIEGDTSSEENRFIETEKFCIIANRYGELEYEKGVFKAGNDTFELNSFTEKYSEEFDFDFEKLEPISSSFEETKKVVSKIGIVSGYADVDPTSAFYGISIQKDWIFSTDRYKMGASFIETNIELDVPFDIVKILYQGGLANENISFYKGDEKFGISVNDDILRVISSDSANFEFPVFQELKKDFYYDTCLSLDRKEFEDKIRFIQPFVKDIINQRVTLTLGEKNISLEVKGNGNLDIKIGLKEISPEIVGQFFMLSQTEILNMLHVFGSSKELNVRISPEETNPAIVFEDNELKDKGNIVILIKMA